MPITYKKQFIAETEEELLKMSRAEVTLHLNDKQIAFCEYYVKNHNIKLSAIKAGYTPKSAHGIGWKLRQNEDCNRYLAWLKIRVSSDCHVSALEIIDQYARIAFADITDFVEIVNGKLRVRDGAELDGQIITKLKEGGIHEGVTIELADKFAALSRLERYFDIMPADWKQKIEERKVDILQQRLDIEKIKVLGGEESQEDDGFIEALKATATEIWEDE
jgi:phage terminase small subunit